MNPFPSYLLDKPYHIFTGFCQDVMKDFPDNSIDSVVTDPPYGLTQYKQKDIQDCLSAWLQGNVFEHKKKGFMAKEWDGWVPGPEIWLEVFRVLKPGGHMLVFSGSRTIDLMNISLRLAGFEIRDQMMWLYGSGYPKSRNVEKALKEKGWESDKFAGYGSALKPCMEPISLCRKPLEGDLATNVHKWGVGGINIDGCRVGMRSGNESGWSKTGSKESENRAMSGKNYTRDPKDEKGLGRWPATVIHDGSYEILQLFPTSKGAKGSGMTNTPARSWKNSSKEGINRTGYMDDGSAARFFYCSKPSKKERDEGLEGMEERQYSHDGRKKSIENPYQRNNSKAKNFHPTIKPVSLLEYLVRLITPDLGIVLDPFMGSGTTGKACMNEKRHFLGIDVDPDYCEIADKRISYAYNQTVLGNSQK